MKKILSIILILIMLVIFNTISYAKINYIIDGNINSYTGKDVTIKLDDEKIKNQLF